MHKKLLALILLIVVSGVTYYFVAGDSKPPVITQKQEVFKEVKYILALKKDCKDADQLGQYIRFAAETFQVDSKLLVAIAFQESSFQTDAINNNDLGLFQLNYTYQIVRKGRPYTVEEVVKDWKLNTILAAQYLRECMAIKPANKLETYTCFHSYTYEKALIYQQGIRRHLIKLADIK